MITYIYHIFTQCFAISSYAFMMLQNTFASVAVIRIERDKGTDMFLEDLPLYQNPPLTVPGQSHWHSYTPPTVYIVIILQYFVDKPHILNSRFVVLLLKYSPSYWKKCSKVGLPQFASHKQAVGLI